MLFGFSQGCLMTIEVGARYPHKFAGLVGVSGYVFEPERLVKEFSPMAKEQRFLVTHGLQDPVVPFAVTREHIKVLKAASLNIAWHEFRKEHTIAGEPEIRLIREIHCGQDLNRKCEGCPISNSKFKIQNAKIEEKTWGRR